jgi:MSHA biogenesis protein MshG
VPTYTYKGRNSSGSLVNGQIQAATVEAAATELLSNSVTPIDIAETAQASRRNAGEGGLASLLTAITGGNRIDITEQIIFSRQMYSLTKAGMPIDRALRGLEASVNKPAMKRLLRDVAGQLEKGVDLTGALSRHPQVFSPLYLSLIHVGENTGRLDLAFEQIGKYLELERTTTKQVKSATRYPMFVMVAIAVALTIITIWVIPVFADTFERLQAELPWQTRVLIAISDFMVAYWYVLLTLLFGALWLFRRWVKTEAGGRQWDKHKVGFPLVGGIFERIALARFSRTFAMMMKAGVPVVQSLNVIARAVGNRYIGENVARMGDGISKGESLYQTAVKSGMFSPLVLQMIAVGEESGSVDTLLMEVADFYDAEVEYDLKKLASAIEPILIVCIAGMVLILALGVFLPIWDLASAAR